MLCGLLVIFELDQTNMCVKPLHLIPQLYWNEWENLLEKILSQKLPLHWKLTNSYNHYPMVAYSSATK